MKWHCSKSICFTDWQSNRMFIYEPKSRAIEYYKHTDIDFVMQRTLLIGKDLYTISGPDVTISIYADVRSTNSPKKICAATLGQDYRCNYAVTSFQERLIYITGGHNISGPTNTTLVFDVKSRTIKGAACMQSARYLHKNCSLGENIFIIGGYNDQHIIADTIERLSIVGKHNKWESIRFEALAGIEISSVCALNSTKLLIFGWPMHDDVKNSFDDVLTFDANTNLIEKAAEAPYKYYMPI